MADMMARSTGFYRIASGDRRHMMKEYVTYQRSCLRRLENQLLRARPLFKRQTDSMRIAIPVVSLEPGGGTRVLHEIAAGLQAYGHNVVFAMVNGQRVDFPVQCPIVNMPYLAPEFMPPADILLPNFYRTVPAALSGHGMPVRLCLSYEPLFVQEPEVAARTYRIPMPVITISTWLRRLLLEQTGRQSQVVNPGIDHRIFHPAVTQRSSGTVMCIARNTADGYGFKGFSVFAQAIAGVRKKRPDLRVIVVSPDLQQHGLPFQASIVHYPSDSLLADLYRQTTVFVFPSFFEGFGLPPLEAMACGSPVVVTACGGVSDYARDGENCLMVPPGDADQLAQAILRLLGDSSLRARLSSAAVETARPWTWTRTIDQMDCLLRQILARQIWS